mmetsp:Transcript_26406/g.82328  ORF Transcript_26406/g.82328 Transcript_26406/m.82328 type:complete len:136 (+) Transcript_26406:766-1173(+)
MDDDLNTPRAYAALFKLVKAAEGGLKAARREEKALDAAQAAAALSAMEEMDQVFGFFYEPEAPWMAKPKQGAAADASADGVDVAALPGDVKGLIESRAAAKAAKDWAEADRIRDELVSKGFAVKDAKSGVVVTRV